MLPLPKKTLDVKSDSKSYILDTMQDNHGNHIQGLLTISNYY